MSHFNFPRQLSSDDLQQHVAQRRSKMERPGSMSMVPQQMDQHQFSDMSEMTGGDSLDDIIMQNIKEIQRRQSYSRPYNDDMLGNDQDRRASMREFGARINNFNGFQFGPQITDNGNSSSRRPSIDDIDMSFGMSGMPPNNGMNDSGYSNTMQQMPLSIDTMGNYDMSADDVMNSMMQYSAVEDTTPLTGMFGNSAYPMPFPVNMQDFSMPMAMPDPQSTDTMNGQQQHTNGENNDNADMQNSNGGPLTSKQLHHNIDMSQRTGTLNNTPSSGELSRSMSNNDDLFPGAPKVTDSQIQQSSTSLASPQQAESKPPSFANVYSSSGFDMLGALMRVATRKNPEIDIGAVDMSCAFVVCDVSINDCPIIYVSDIFERLTGYNKHEVLGRNCRFLQSPDGKVTPGVPRKYVDDESVYYIKSRITKNQEAQRSLINYRKGGQPFMNLLTMIPIPWDTDDIRYIVGFQVDLVEQPGSVAGKGAGGTYTVNYSQNLLPKYVWQPPDSQRLQIESGQTISRDDVSQVLLNFSSNSDSEITKRMWDKVLLENTDDVVHVLSLKGLFLYLSPSARNVLEYDASELVGTALSSVCHPSDIVPVTRELKDTSTGATVNVVFRIRRKNSGYTWFESHGSLCVEQGKGRKCIILVGRERPVYALARHDIEHAGGIGENEMWAKLSTSGMFLFVSSNTRMLLDRQPDDLVGTSIQAIMRPESKIEFGRVLERARTGKRVNFKHEVMNKRGQVLQAHTTFYPGDAAEGQKPTFLVGQIRLVKQTSRHTLMSLQHQSSGKSSAMTITGAGSVDMAGDDGRNIGNAGTQGHHDSNREAGTPKSTASSEKFVTTQAGSSGLLIGSQDAALASEDNVFDELKTTRCTSWQFELRQMEKSNRLLAEELATLLSSKKKRKRRKGAGHLQRDCANCHTRVTPEWRRGPSGNRDLCNSCGLRWAKQQGRVSPRNASSRGDTRSKHSASPTYSSPVQNDGNTNAQSTSQTVNATNGIAVLGPNLNPHPTHNADVVDLGDMRAVVGKDKRTTGESIPVHKPSQGFQEGGPNGITKIEEENT